MNGIRYACNRNQVRGAQVGVASIPTCDMHLMPLIDEIDTDIDADSDVDHETHFAS